MRMDQATARLICSIASPWSTREPLRSLKSFGSLPVGASVGARSPRLVAYLRYRGCHVDPLQVTILRGVIRTNARGMCFVSS